MFDRNIYAGELVHVKVFAQDEWSALCARGVVAGSRTNNPITCIQCFVLAWRERDLVTCLLREPRLFGTP